MKHSADYPLTIRPIVAFADDYAAGFIDPFHSHQRSQLCFAASGVMSVMTDSNSFILPPRRAIWIPAGMNHQVACRGRVELHVLYVDPELDTQPQQCRVFETSSLVRALIEEILTFEHAYDEAGREGVLVRLLLDEIARMPNIDIHAPMPEDKRLLRVCNAILANPADPRDIDDWADVAGMGRRTFTRAFKDNTGMGLATWRQQVRLMEALSLLHAGWAVTSVAYEVGYESPSAFTAMFHRTFGMTPTQMIEA